MDRSWGWEEATLYGQHEDNFEGTSTKYTKMLIAVIELGILFRYEFTMLILFIQPCCFCDSCMFHKILDIIVPCKY